MLVNFKSDFFSRDGVLYKKGTNEFNGPVKDADGNSLLPSTAVIVSKDGALPVHENTPKAGFGAKPLEEQVLDMIPGAGKTHQIDVGGSMPRINLSDKEREEREKAAENAGDAEREATKEADKELADSVAKALPAAEAAADKVKEVTDPLAGLGSAPKKK